MKLKIPAIFMLLVTVLLYTAGAVYAQPSLSTLPPNSTPIAADQVPAAGTFWLAVTTFQDFPSCSNPGTGVEILVSSAKDYIRFKPGTSDNDGNIYVTLGVVNWNAHGIYSSFSGITTNSTPAASPPDASDNFPTWVQIITSSGD